MFQPASRDNGARGELGWGARFVAMYAGAHGLANALSQLVGAAEELRDRPDILIACVGDGPAAARPGRTSAVARTEQYRFSRSTAEIDDAGDCECLRRGSGGAAK